jgi:hypothetical protein
MALKRKPNLSSNRNLSALWQKRKELKKIDVVQLSYMNIYEQFIFLYNKLKQELQQLLIDLKAQLLSRLSFAVYIF